MNSTLLLSIYIASSSNTTTTGALTYLLNHKESITFFIALAGFLLSIYNFICSLIQNHIKLRITYKNHLCDNKNFMVIMMNIENLSRLPISISRMFLNIGNNTFEFSSMQQFAYERTLRCGNEVYDRVVTHTLELPQDIPALGTVGGFFHVVGQITNEQLSEEKTTITLWTTRGKRTYEVFMNNEQRHPN